MAPIPPQHTPNSVADQALPRVIHRVRYSAFVMGFAIFASHMQGKDYNLLAWGLLGLQFFIYPHVLHWRIRHAIHPLERLLTHFQIDGFLMGIWCASLGYPLWVTFVILAASVLSASLYGGLRAAVAAGLDTVITPNRFTAHHDFKGALRVVPDLGSVNVARLKEWHHR